MKISTILDILYHGVRKKDFYLLQDRNEDTVRAEITQKMKEFKLKNIDYYITVSQLDNNVLIKL